MFNPFQHVNWKPDRNDLRCFARSLVVGFPVVALLFFIAGRLIHGTWDPVFPGRLALIGVLAGVVFWILPVVSRPFYIVWYAVSCAIGLVVSNLLLSALFYLIFTVIGILRRTLGRSPVQRHIARNASSYWIDAGAQSEARSYYNQS